MASEQKRGCGYRKVGGLYLCGEKFSVACDRLPIELTVCPTCGAGLKLVRGYTRFDPLTTWGYHAGCLETMPCVVCGPPNDGFLMEVGEQHYKTPGDFIGEANAQGISKRIAAVPQG